MLGHAMDRQFWSELEALTSHPSETVRAAAARCRNRRETAKSVIKDWCDLTEREEVAHTAMKAHADGKLGDTGLISALGMLEACYFKALSR